MIRVSSWDREVSSKFVIVISSHRRFNSYGGDWQFLATVLFSDQWQGNNMILAFAPNNTVEAYRDDDGSNYAEIQIKS